MRLKRIKRRTSIENTFKGGFGWDDKIIHRVYRAHLLLDKLEKED